MSSLQLFQMLLVVVSVQLMAVTFSEARVFSRCDLARTLLNTYKFNRADLANWVCLIEAESGRNTAAIGSPNSNGSRDYGLFQINSLYWCSGGPGSKYNECNVSCKALTNDDITDDVNCVRKIFGRHGFSAWYGWINKCKGKNVSSYIAGCGV